ncbi:MAG: hypothetical protein HY748_04165 [Elusimicrobia bacterium]|nr:hypothetical protein [Elusimicrobiota bacterium]
MLYKIPVVVMGENRTFKGPESYSRKRVELVNLDLKGCRDMMADFIRRRPELWNEDIGV